MIKVFGLILVVLLISAVTALFIEGTKNNAFHGLGESLWWAVVTMTTVGYGDVVPSTTAGRIIGGILMFSGVAVISVFTATVSTIFVTRRMREAKGLQDVNVKNHIIICGWYPTVEDIIIRLFENIIKFGRTVVLVNELQEDEIESILLKYSLIDIRFVHGNFTDESILHRANINEAYAALILPDTTGEHSKAQSDERTILATLTIKAIQPKVKVFAHILDPQSEPHLRRANVDRITLSDRHSGYFMASHVNDPGIPELVDGLLQGTLGKRISRVDVPNNYVGKTFIEFSNYCRTTHGAILLGFISEEEGVRIDDILSGDYSSIDDFIKRKLEEAGLGLERQASVQVNLNPSNSYTITDQDVGIVIENVETA